MSELDQDILQQTIAQLQDKIKHLGLLVVYYNERLQSLDQSLSAVLLQRRSLDGTLLLYKIERLDSVDEIISIRTKATTWVLEDSELTLKRNCLQLELLKGELA